MKKLKHFDSPEAALTWMHRELIDSLTDDMRRCKEQRDPDWKDLRDKILDLDAIEDRIIIRPATPATLESSQAVTFCHEALSLRLCIPG